MNGMSFRQLPSSSSGGGAVERLVGALFGLLVWAMLALIGLVFAASLLIWLLVMVVVSLVSSLFTGRPAAVTVLWRRYRELTRQRWPQRPGASSTPRADAASATGATGATGAARPSGVEDVAWREVPAHRNEAAARQDPRR